MAGKIAAEYFVDFLYMTVKPNSILQFRPLAFAVFRFSFLENR
jgi:hypothetical protein